MELKGKTALVTGAGMGIGRATALRLAREGTCVIVNDMLLKEAESTAAKIEDSNGEAFAFEADVADRTKVQEMVEAGIRRFGMIDILVNNAGTGSLFLMKDMPYEAWDRNVAITFTGSFNCCKAVIPHMINKQSGKIVFIASTAAIRMSTVAGADYTAAKHGILGLNHQLAYELAEYGINVNAINPGITLTERAKKLLTKEQRQKLMDNIPLGKFCMPEDIAEAVVFLASERSRMITGQTLTVDGGWMLGLASGYAEDMKMRQEVSRKAASEWQAEND